MRRMSAFGLAIFVLAMCAYGERPVIDSFGSNGELTCTNLTHTSRYVVEWAPSDGDTSVGSTTVGSYAVNAWGLYDTHGNVLELCLDWYGPYPGDVTDPRGATTNVLYRVARGGGWWFPAAGCRMRDAC